MAEWLAHSAGINPPVQPQSYYKHVSEVLKRALKNVDSLSPHYKGDLEYFREAVRAAAIYHDLGKLDDENQTVLSQGGSKGLPIHHQDAGTSWLLKNGMGRSSILVYSHHIGLPSIPVELAKDEFCLRDHKVMLQTEQKLCEYITKHVESGFEQLKEIKDSPNEWNGLILRVALSCLVDGDHGDTARNYGKEFLITCQEPRWKERLEKLDGYVDGLANDVTVAIERKQLRQRIYQACRDAETLPPFYACDSPVGTGKTTAVMAHLLRAAIDKKLRHIIVVLPYTNIIKQSVDVYRKALVLPGEKADEVVAEHHHQADFDAMEVRQLTTLWKAPIIVTTAVQFFETIASNHTSRLRKLHELPGSGVFVDEMHSAIPTHLWPQTWKWLKDLAENWSCHFVFASGSLSRFWELNDMIKPTEHIPELVSTNLRDEAIRQERSRVIPVRETGVLNVEKLIDLVLSKPTPRLVIMNTVQSAAVVADSLARKIYGEDYPIDLLTTKVLHLSTSLAPIHREEIIKVVSDRLKNTQDVKARNFTLVATSCVEAGVDFSFRSAFRERAGASNLIQVGGRVRRHNEDFEPTLIDFKIEDSMINHHPAFEFSRQVLESLFNEGRVETDSPADLVTEALRRELMSDTSTKHLTLQRNEDAMDYPEVSKIYKVIAENTFMVVVDQTLIQRLVDAEKIDPRELNRNSVQIWSHNLTKNSYNAFLFPISYFRDLYTWKVDGYDKNFLGYMKGIIPNLRMNTQGYDLI